jgi:hypothetical protein
MTLGVRMYDRKLTVATRVLAVDAKRKEEIPDSPALSGSPDLPPSAAYMITNLYMGYQPTPASPRHCQSTICSTSSMRPISTPMRGARPAARSCRSRAPA